MRILGVFQGKASGRIIGEIYEWMVEIISRGFVVRIPRKIFEEFLELLLKEAEIERIFLEKL